MITRHFDFCWAQHMFRRDEILLLFLFFLVLVVCVVSEAMTPPTSNLLMYG